MLGYYLQRALIAGTVPFTLHSNLAHKILPVDSSERRVRVFFELPYVAMILGSLYGFLLIGAYGFTALKFTGDQAKLGLYISFGVSIIELLVTLAVLLLYRTFAKAGVVYFGASMAIGFVAGLTFLVLKLVVAPKKYKRRDKDRS